MIHFKLFKPVDFLNSLFNKTEINQTAVSALNATAIAATTALVNQNTSTNSSLAYDALSEICENTHWEHFLGAIQNNWNSIDEATNGFATPVVGGAVATVGLFWGARSLGLLGSSDADKLAVKIPVMEQSSGVTQAQMDFQDLIDMVMNNTAEDSPLRERVNTEAFSSQFMSMNDASRTALMAKISESLTNNLSTIRATM